MTCQETRSQLSAYLDAPRGADVNRDALARHLEGCGACRTELRQLERVDTMLGSLKAAPWTDEARDRQLARLGQALASAEPSSEAEAKARERDELKALASMAADGDGDDGGETAGLGGSDGPDAAHGTLSGIDEIHELAAAALAARERAKKEPAADGAAALSRLALAIPPERTRRPWLLPLAGCAAGLVLGGVGVAMYVSRLRSPAAGAQELAAQTPAAAPAASAAPQGSGTSGAPQLAMAEPEVKTPPAGLAPAPAAAEEGQPSSRGPGSFDHEVLATGDVAAKASAASGAEERARATAGLAAAFGGAGGGAPAPARAGARAAAAPPAAAVASNANPLANMIDGAGNSVPVAPPKPAAVAAPAPPPPAAPAAAPAKVDDIDNLLGASKGAGAGGTAAGAAAASANLPPRLSTAQVEAGMQALGGRVQACYDKLKVAGTVMTSVRIAPDGSVASANAKGPFASTPTGACVEEAVQRGHFPAFSGPPMDVTYPFILRADD